MSKSKSRGSSLSLKQSQRPSYNESANLYASGMYSEIDSRNSGACSQLVPVSCSVSPVSLGNVNLIRRKYLTIQSLISHPICCGYLLQFCQSEYNAESLSLILEVDELRDTFASDQDAWKYDWKDLDKQVILFEKQNGLRDIDFGDTENVPGKILREGSWASHTDKCAAMARVESILQKYLSPDSSTQVCISEITIKRTMKRIGLLHLYGPEVFEEACLEPIKTMRKDILPRFLNSEIASRMVQNVASCEPKPPPASDLKVPPPDRNFLLEEILNCLQLDNEFFFFLKKSQTSENLICVRMIVIFEELMNKLDLRGAGMQAWKIYQYFVAPGSAYEVSIHHVYRKQIMLGMADPKQGMFQNLRRSANEILKVSFDSFTLTEQYRHLGLLMRNQKIELGDIQHCGAIDPYNSFGCFGLSRSSKK
jgi:Regulator of G protein signaling domain